jgi:hypothetical protein
MQENKYAIHECLDNLQNIVDWYHGIPIDFLGINELMNQRRKLVTWFYYFNVAVGEFRQTKGDVEADYNEKLADAVAFELSDSHKHNQAEAKAKSQLSYLNEGLERAKSNYYRLKDQQEAISKVLDAMQQDIAVIREELNKRL